MMLATQGLLREKGLSSLDGRGIAVKEYPDSVILNYTFAKKDDPVACECRGLHLDRNGWSVISRAFPRFFNAGEIPGDGGFVFDGRTLVQEKLDGSLVIFYHRNGEWRVRTRNTAFAEASFGDRGLTARAYVLKAIGKGDLSFLEGRLDPAQSHVFELTCPENRVVTPYADTDLWYLASFVNESGEEIDLREGIGGILRCRLPVEHGFSSLSEAAESAKALPELQEGYVARDFAGRRLKIKNPGWVALHLFRNNGAPTGKSALSAIESGEDGEYLALFPCDRPLFDGIRQKRDAALELIAAEWEEAKHLEDRKEFALKVSKSPFSPVLFKMREGRNLESAWKEMKAGLKEKLVLGD